MEVSAGSGEVPPDPASVLAEAAVAVHGRRDLPGIVDWVLRQAVEMSGAQAAALWLLVDDVPDWTTIGNMSRDPSRLGDPRDWPGLRQAMEHGTTLELLEGRPSGADVDPGLRDLLRAPRTLVVPLPPVE